MKEALTCNGGEHGSDGWSEINIEQGKWLANRRQIYNEILLSLSLILANSMDTNLV